MTLLIFINKILLSATLICINVYIVRLTIVWYSSIRAYHAFKCIDRLTLLRKYELPKSNGWTFRFVTIWGIWGNDNALEILQFCTKPSICKYDMRLARIICICNISEIVITHPLTIYSDIANSKQVWLIRLYWCTMLMKLAHISWGIFFQTKGKGSKLQQNTKIVYRVQISYMYTGCQRITMTSHGHYGVSNYRQFSGVFFCLLVCCCFLFCFVVFRGCLFVCLFFSSLFKQLVRADNKENIKTPI